MPLLLYALLKHARLSNITIHTKHEASNASLCQILIV